MMMIHRCLTLFCLIYWNGDSSGSEFLAAACMHAAQHHGATGAAHHGSNSSRKAHGTSVSLRKQTHSKAQLPLPQCR